ncbi:toxin HigB [Endozoicomonas montiporae CL-33]|nr:toxin HigB [Endozoicomonas montiporae CL-33]
MGKKSADHIILIPTQKPWKRESKILQFDKIRQCRIFIFMIFIETSKFTKLLSDYLSDDEYRMLQWHLQEKPDSGDIVRGSGGVRKVRWAPEGKGKSGGVRVIYYWKKSEHEMWMLTIYSKSDQASIPGHILKNIAEAIENE